MDQLAHGQAPAEATWLADDGVFGPQYGQEFDFSMVFNNTILTILPAALLIAACPAYILSSFGKSPVTSKTRPVLYKLAVALGLVIFDITRSAVWSYPQGATSLLTNTTLAAKIMATASSGTLAAVLYYDHRYARQSSSFLSVLLSISVVTEGSRTRSFFLRASSGMAEMTSIASLTLVGVVLRTALVVLLELPKDLTQFTDNKLVPNATTGFWSRSLLIWTNSIMMRGYNRQITMSDLASLGPDTESQWLADRMAQVWGAADKTDKHALTKTCLKVLFWPILWACFGTALAQTVFFGSIFVLRATLNQLETSGSNIHAVRGVIGANVLIQAATSIVGSIMKENQNHLAIMIRGSLIGIMADKATRLPSATAKKSALLSLMTADINAIVDPLFDLCLFSIALPMTAVGLYLLWTVIGYASFFTIIGIVLSLVVSRFTGRSMQPAMSRWNQAIQLRVTETAGALMHIKAIKMMGLEPVIVRFLNNLREREIEASLGYRKVRIATVASYSIHFWFAPFITLVGAVKVTVWKDSLDPVGVWVALSFARGISEPMMYILQGSALLGGVSACIRRIQDFLLQDERVDARQLKDFTADSNKTDWAEKDKVQEEDDAAEGQSLSLTGEGTTHNPCIVLENLSVAANEADAFVLKDLRFSIPAKKLTVIIGPVGSGKSVLAKTIIGEIMPAGGSIYISSLEMAYCDQNPWLPNVSIQDAITMNSVPDKARYNAIIEACALERDIQELGSDQARIGSGGSKLSGGQRQRLALARALYSTCPIIVADDVLSALDQRTAKHIFKSVFGSDGMLKRQGRTAILVAHERAWLPWADQVVSLRCDGQPAAVYRGKEAIRVFSETEGVVISAAFLSHAQEEEEKPVEKRTASDQALEYALEDEKRAAYKPDLSLYRYLFKSVSITVATFSMGFIMIYGFSACAPDLYIRLWVGYSPRKTDYVWGLLGFMLVCMSLAFCNSYFFAFKVIPVISRRTHATFSHSVFGATLSFLTSTGNGNLLNRFGQDLSILGAELPQALSATLYKIAGYISIFAFVLVGTNYTLLLIPAILAMMWLLQKFYLRTSQQMRVLDLQAKAPLFAELSEMGTGIEHVRSFGVQDQVLQRSFQRLDDSQRPYYYLLTVQRWLLFMLDNITLIVASVVVTIALLAIKTTSQAALGLSLYNLVSFSELSKALIQDWTSLETSLGAAMRLRDFEENTPSERDSVDMQDAPEAWPTKGCVEFQNVSATYGPEPGLPLALRGITTTIEGGKKVVIAGRTGSGKSTLMLSIVNLVDISGTILIDNVDITKVPRLQLRSRITSMPQDSLDFAGSVWQNLLPLGAERPNGDAITEQEVEGLLEDIGLWDHVKAKGGLETPIAEMIFSAGQKQLFNVIRAILHHSQFQTKIVLMDEVTSSVDHVAKERIQGMMEAAFRGSTWIIISHDGRAVINCDTVLRMDGGTLVEDVRQSSSEKMSDTSSEKNSEEEKESLVKE